MNCDRVCGLKLWQVVLLLHVVVTAVNLRSHGPCCTAQLMLQDVVPVPPMMSPLDEIGTPDAEELFVPFGYMQRYFYAHNETRIAMARAEAEASALQEESREGHGAAATTSVPSSAKFPDVSLTTSEPDGCNWDDRFVDDLAAYDARDWYASNFEDRLEVQLIAMDSCVKYRDVVQMGEQNIQVSSKPYPKQKPDIDLVTRRGSSEIQVLVKIAEGGKNILAEGVYYPATGRMQLVGCTRELYILPSSSQVVVNLTDPDRESWVKMMDHVDYATFSEFESQSRYWSYSYDRDVARLVSSSGVCAMSVTLQYPALDARWNWHRVLKLTLRSTRDADDPLYFDPVERSVFWPYRFHGERLSASLRWQGPLKTAGRCLLLLLGIVCVALQIQHGRNNGEALPFVSLATLGIQIANHVSQLSLFQDLQIGRYRMLDSVRPSPGPDAMFRRGIDSFLHSKADFDYYGTMMWHEYVPYQAFAMAAIFMYVWIFHRVGDRRRIMQLRVRKKRPGARDPPRDGQLVYATIAIFGLVGVCGIVANSVDYYGVVGKPESIFGWNNVTSIHWPGYEGGRIYDKDWFVSPIFYVLWYAQWGFVNRLTGLVVSLFLVPQLLGNWRWAPVQGRPLSAWFYVGLPFLQSLPHVFAIATHFQLLPILARYDPYLNSLYGIYEHLNPWWQIAVVSCSALLVLAVHLQFAASFRPSRLHSSSTENSPHAQTCDMLC